MCDVIPYWAITALLAIPLVARTARILRHRALPPNHCRACGYDMRATPDRCPECGAAP